MTLNCFVSQTRRASAHALNTSQKQSFDLSAEENTKGNFGYFQPIFPSFNVYGVMKTSIWNLVQYRARMQEASDDKQAAST